MKKGACPTDLAFLDQASALPPTLFGGGLVFGSRAEHQAWSTCSFRLRIFRLTRRPQFLANARHNQSMRYQTHIAQEFRGRITAKLTRSFSIGVRSVGRDDATRVSRMLAAAIRALSSLDFGKRTLPTEHTFCGSSASFSERAEMAASKRSIRDRHFESGAAIECVRLKRFWQ